MKAEGRGDFCHAKLYPPVANFQPKRNNSHYKGCIHGDTKSVYMYKHFALSLNVPMRGRC